MARDEIGRTDTAGRIDTGNPNIRVARPECKKGYGGSFRESFTPQEASRATRMTTQPASGRLHS